MQQVAVWHWQRFHVQIYSQSAAEHTVGRLCCILAVLSLAVVTGHSAQEEMLVRTCLRVSNPRILRSPSVPLSHPPLWRPVGPMASTMARPTEANIPEKRTHFFFCTVFPSFVLTFIDF